MKVGILGAGQLAQLLTHAAYPLGIKTICVNETDYESIAVQTKDCDVITLENENVDVALLAQLQKHVTIYPGIEAVKVAQDRLFEKTLFQSLNIPTPAFAEVSTLADLEKAIQITRLPAILKTRRLGYDGKGQVVICQKAEAATAWDTIGKVPAILEGFVAFDFEVSLIGARNPAGEKVFYPLSKNTHREGILRIAESPYDNSHLQQLAEKFMTALFEKFDYVGVLAFEFFVKGNELIANEIAPRVHNSGHLTIEGFNVSQFETHLRSVLNLPLVQPILRTPTLMYNIIGTFPHLSSEEYKHIHVYNYGKSERPKRKLGHITFLQEDNLLLQKLKANY